MLEITTERALKRAECRNSFDPAEKPVIYFRINFDTRQFCTSAT